MDIRYTVATLVLILCAVACTQQADQDPTKTQSTTMEAAAVTATEANEIQSIEIAPGLSARILKAGDGALAQSGDNVDVHYTGWLYDEEAADNRGEKFDSSVDRGTKFQFQPGAGKVTKGWGTGVMGVAMG